MQGNGISNVDECCNISKQVLKQIGATNFIVARSRRRLNSVNLIKIWKQSWMMGIKEVMNHIRIIRILMNIKIFWLRMCVMGGSRAMALATLIIKSTMIYHSSFGVIEGM
jgi:hypothetical protein